MQQVDERREWLLNSTIGCEQGEVVARTARGRFFFQGGIICIILMSRYWKSVGTIEFLYLRQAL